MKKGLKALVAIVAAGALLMSMSLAAFAATYTTETVYVAGDNTKVQVTTNVTGLSGSEQVAYLVTSNNDSEIVWVDQKPATDGAVEFKFKTAAANAKGAGSTILVGSQSIAAGEFDASKQNLIKLADATATWSVAKGADDKEHGKVYAVEAENVTGSVTGSAVTFVALPDAGYALTGITKNGEAVAFVAGTNERTFDLAANAEFVFTFSAVAAGTPTAAFTGTTLAVADKTVSIPAKATNATEFGILVGEGASALDAAAIAAMESNVNVNGITKYAALGANEDGAFIISLTDNGDVFNGTNEFDGVVYAINGANVAFSSAFTFGK
jgi:hypothetical protein